MGQKRGGTNSENPFKSGDQVFCHLIKNSFDIIGLVDADGFSKYVSETCERFLGYKQHELIGVPVIDLFVHPDDKPVAREGMRQIIEEGKSGGMQYWHRHKNGGWVFLEAFGTNQIDNPAIKAVVLNVRDITEEKKAEEALRESERRLKEINAIKNRFFSIIGHDLKSPISSIVGVGRVLVDLAEKRQYREIEEYVRALQEASHHTMNLLDNLLEWSKSQRGKIAYNPEKLNLFSVVSGIKTLFDGTAKEKQIFIQNKIPEGLTVKADLYMLNVIMRNLVSNGLKFTNPGGEIVISGRKDKEYMVISVSDTGVGVNEDDLKKLFQFDYHYSTKGTKMETGTGLGLLLCFEFVKMQGGEIWAESKTDQGTVFSFSLPHNVRV